MKSINSVLLKTAVQNPAVTQFLKPGCINLVTVIGNKFGLRYLKKRMSILSSSRRETISSWNFSSPCLHRKIEKTSRQKAMSFALRCLAVWETLPKIPLSDTETSLTITRVLSLRRSKQPKPGNQAFDSFCLVTQ